MRTARDHAHDVKVMPGQIIVIFTLMIAILAAFTGMAIDLAHARGVAQDAQRAADAAALAGVVYLPSSTAKANTNADSESTANGFTDNCTSTSTCGASGTVRISTSSNVELRQLTVYITKWMPTSFLGVVGLHTIAVSRSATATYADPITLGAPDHVLGFAPYPTNAVSICTSGETVGANCQSHNPYAQAFWLEVRGPWTGVEHGDAFSPYFENYQAGDKIHTTSGATPPQLTGCAGTSCTAGANTYPIQPNPMLNQQDAPGSSISAGYNFVYAFPPGMLKPALIKLFDPLDECNPQVASPGGNVTGWNGPPSGAQQSQVVSTQFVDQCWDEGWFTSWHPTSLQFTVYEPSNQLAEADKTAPANNTNGGFDSTGNSNWTAGTGKWALKVPTNSERFGGDNPAVVSGRNSGYKWFTLGEFMNNTDVTQYVLLNVDSVINGDGSGGTGGNDFALGVCKDDATDADMGHQSNAAEWLLGSTSGIGAAPNGANSGVDQGCADPNFQLAGDQYGCADSTVTCYHVNALTAFCLETLQQAGAGGQALIPLAQIDQHFANSDVTLRLFDAGDIGNGSNYINILGPDTDPGNPTIKFGLDLSSPSGSGYGNSGMGRGAGTPNAWWGTAAAPYNCSGDYNADDYPNGTGPICPPLTTLTAGGGVTQVYPAWGAGNHDFGNGTWLDFHIQIPASYAPPLTDQWWKVLYNTSAPADDTTTWEVVSGAAPAHLIDSVN